MTKLEHRLLIGARVLVMVLCFGAMLGPRAYSLLQAAGGSALLDRVTQNDFRDVKQETQIQDLQKTTADVDTRVRALEATANQMRGGFWIIQMLGGLVGVAQLVQVGLQVSLYRRMDSKKHG